MRLLTQYLDRCERYEAWKNPYFSHFPPTLIDASNNLEEVWFAGVHADVGGGYSARGLADISLRFMAMRLRRHDVSFDEASLQHIPVNK